MKIIFSKKCLEYKFPEHPESPERVKIIYDTLLENNFNFLEPKPCSEKDILLVHTQDLLDQVKHNSFFDRDTPNIQKIFDYAKLGVGAAIEAAESALSGENAFSLMRPPGHHAGKDSLGGFCYFNNIAIAVEKFLKNVKLIAILDLDVHHGNGTEDIFLGRKEVQFISLHQNPLYPGTGLVSEKNCLNYPLKNNTSSHGYIKVLKNALEEIKKFRPGLLAISLGLDTYKNEFLAGLKLEIEDYETIGELINNLNLKTF
ncbi:MAG: histone deacetylase, partial [Candidatus Omnitrophota bacterium]